jgi:hypothetical protein
LERTTARERDQEGPFNSSLFLLPHSSITLVLTAAHKLAMAPHLASFPRKRRVLVLVFFVLCIWALLPMHSLNLPRRALQAALGSTYLSGFDALQYVDPLIGTVNGGEHLAAPGC